MKDQAAPAGLNAGLPFRRINFVRARDPGAHSVTPHVDLVPLNSVEVCDSLPHPLGGSLTLPDAHRFGIVADALHAPSPARQGSSSRSPGADERGGGRHGCLLQ